MLSVQAIYYAFPILTDELHSVGMSHVILLFAAEIGLGSIRILKFRPEMVVHVAEFRIGSLNPAASRHNS